MSPSGPRSKGTNFIPTVKFLRVHREEVRALLPAELKGYLEERILPASWYPEEDLMRLLRVLVQLLPGEPRAAWESIGTQAADAHVAGPYERLVRQGPRSLLSVFDPIWRLLHDTGRWEIELAEEVEVAEARLLDFPVGMPEYGDLMSGYFRRILPLSGAASARAELVDRDGSSARWRVEWTTGS